MEPKDDRRHTDRIRFFWPLWLGYEDNGELFRGQVVDLNNSHVSCTVEEQYCPSVGQHITTRFSYPLNTADKFAIGSYLHWSEVIRVDQVRPGTRRIALRLHRPITLNPAGPKKATGEALSRTA